MVSESDLIRDGKMGRQEELNMDIIRKNLFWPDD